MLGKDKAIRAIVLYVLVALYGRYGQDTVDHVTSSSTVGHARLLVQEMDRGEGGPLRAKSHSRMSNLITSTPCSVHKGELMFEAPFPEETIDLTLLILHGLSLCLTADRVFRMKRMQDMTRRQEGMSRQK